MLIKLWIDTRTQQTNEFQCSNRLTFERSINFKLLKEIRDAFYMISERVQKIVNLGKTCFLNYIYTSWDIIQRKNVKRTNCFSIK